MRQACSRHTLQLARSDPRIVFIGSDLGAGAMSEFEAEMPERFFMEGVSEQHLIGFAAGLAMEGYIPVVNTIATFLTRRCLEQIAIDLCLDSLPVILAGNGGGLVYAPLGPTHLATEDIALLRALPHMTMLSPCDAPELTCLMDQALHAGGPVYLRVGPSGGPILRQDTSGVQLGQPDLLKPPGDVLLVSTGMATHAAMQAAGHLDGAGLPAGVLHLHTLKPLQPDSLLALAREVRLIVTVEEHSRIGGLGSLVLETLSDGLPRHPPVKRIGLPDAFPQGYGSQAHLLAKYGLSAEGIAAQVQAAWGSL